MSSNDAGSGFTFKLYRYTPSLAPAVLFLILFIVITAIHLYQVIRMRSWYMLVLVTGGIFQVIGYICRILAHNDTESIPIYSVQTILILLAPPLYAASIYMTLGRLIRYLDAESLSLVATRWLTTIFLVGDIVAFLMQAAGGGIMASGTLSAMHTGETITIVGLAIQLVFFSVFIITSTIFHRRILARPTSKSISDPKGGWKETSWQTIMVMLYVSSVLILVRSIFRLVEYAQGNDGYLISHEVFIIHASLDPNGRTKYNFNPDWRVFVGDPAKAETPDFKDGDWKSVTTPYAWNEDDAFHVDIAKLSTGIAWYRKHFQLPDNAKGKKIFLEFEGIRQAGEFYLNGQWIGRSENGVMAFGFDITDKIEVGEKKNVLAARIDNSWSYREIETDTPYEWNDGQFYANYGGINKNVYLHVTDRLYQTLPLYSNLETTGPYVYATEIDVAGKSASVTVQTEVRNEYSESKTFAYQADIYNPNGIRIKTLTGETYTLQPNQTKTVSVSAGVSGLEFWSWGYGYLYDIKTALKVSGQTVDTVTTRTGFRKTEFDHGMFKLNDRALHIKGYGLRTTNEWPALGCAVPAWLSELSNRLVLESNGHLIRWMHVTPWKQDVESLDRLGLVQSLPAGDKEEDVTGRPWEQRLELMRDAIIYNRNNPSVIFYESGNHGVSEDHMAEMKALRDKYDPHGGRAAGSREMLNSSIAEYGGEMLNINKGSRIPFWQMEYSRDEGMRKYWDDYSPPYHMDGEGSGEGSAYNRNQDSHAIENVRRWFDYYEQRPGTGTRVNAGGVNIIFSDTNTHHRGAQNYRRSDEVDALRLPKEGWYAHRVMWDNWVDVEKLAGHIIGHWNYNESTVKDVDVVSTADKVELFLDNDSLGWGEQSSRFLFTFANITWGPGTLKAVGYLGKEKATLDTKPTTGEPVGIRLTSQVSPGGFVANGADIAIVEVEVVDSNNQRVPIALNKINFSLSGEGTWRGGIAEGPDNYILSKSLPVENGVNRVMIRSTSTTGKTGGLSTEMPGAGLTPNLSRGPTPKGQPYTVGRKAVKITKVTAGSDEKNAGASFDDDEDTEWSSDSLKDSAWIKYSWDAPANVTQLVMKLHSFFYTKYPIEVRVDDDLVFKGTTPTSLGYVTLNLNATVGKSLTIAMDKDNKLGIVEAEVYTPT
ncbi:hypothetical protein FE257_011391 [Aspergillus nanangensis]|uniref:Beta-galactosidase n=1 Tax=Aspergillus nanangensis TaxID=2582783 RepID=A0AAD4GQM1_ASPNN|nr:hypothetical protein FE257_011391 [Aspergillus nanangensis]